MHSLFDLIFDHQRLCARQRAGEALEAGDRALLAGLGQLLRGERAETRGEPAMPHVVVPGTVRVAVGGAFHVAHVKHVSGDGLEARMRVAPTVGASVLVEVEDPVHDIRYAFPAVVAASSRGVAQLVFNGAPRRGRLAEGTRRWRAASLPVQAAQPRSRPASASAPAPAA
jgi:hypothetical protein